MSNPSPNSKPPMPASPGAKSYKIGGIIVAVAVALGVQFLLSSKRSGTSEPGEQEVARVLTASAEQLNRKGVQMVDEVTRLDRVEAGEGRRLIYHYTILSLVKGETEPEALEGVLRPGIVTNYREHPGMAELRNLGVTLVYRYQDKNGDQLMETSVGPADLKGLSVGASAPSVE